MDEAAFTGVLQAQCSLANVLGCLPDAERPIPTDHFRKRLTIDEFQCNERDAIDLVRIVKDDDVGVLQLPNRMSFASKSTECFRFGFQVLLVNELQGDIPIESRLPGLVDLTHTADAKR